MDHCAVSSNWKGIKGAAYIIKKNKEKSEIENVAYVTLFITLFVRKLWNTKTETKQNIKCLVTTPV